MNAFLDPAVLLALATLAVAVTLLAGCALGVARLLHRRSALVRHGLLLTGLGLCLAAPALVALSARLGLGRLAIELPTTGQGAPVDGGGPEAMPVTGHRPVATPAPRDVASLENAAGRDLTPTDTDPAVATTPRPEVPVGSAAGTATAPASAAPIPVWTVIGACLAATWILGFLLALVRLGRCWRLALVLRRTGRSCTDSAIGAAVATAAARLGLATPPPLRLSPAVPVPVVVGVLRPVILLPGDLGARLEPTQLDAVLLHELAHIAQRDPLVGLCQRLAGALFWWCLPLHRLNRRLDELREDICDDHVVDQQGDGFRLAQVLVQLAERLHAEPPPRLAGAMAITEPRRGSLGNRVERLLQPGRRIATRMNPGSVLGMAVLGLTLGCTVIACTVRPTASTTTGSGTTTASGPGRPAADQATALDLAHTEDLPALAGAGVATVYRLRPGVDPETRRIEDRAILEALRGTLVPHACPSGAAERLYEIAFDQGDRELRRVWVNPDGEWGFVRATPPHWTCGRSPGLAALLGIVYGEAVEVGARAQPIEGKITFRAVAPPPAAEADAEHPVAMLDDKVGIELATPPELHLVTPPADGRVRTVLTLRFHNRGTEPAWINLFDTVTVESPLADGSWFPLAFARDGTFPATPIAVAAGESRDVAFEARLERFPRRGLPSLVIPGRSGGMFSRNDLAPGRLRLRLRYTNRVERLKQVWGYGDAGFRRKHGLPADAPLVVGDAASAPVTLVIDPAPAGEPAEDAAVLDEAAIRQKTLDHLAQSTTDPIRIISARRGRDGTWMVQYIHDTPRWAMPPTGNPCVRVDGTTGVVTPVMPRL